MNEQTKSNWLYFYYAGLAVVLFLLAGVNSYLTVMNELVSMALVALGIAVVLFGIFDSVAKVAVGENSKLGKTFSLGGAAAGFYIVFHLLITSEQPNLSPDILTETTDFDVVFTAPLNTEPMDQHYSELELRFTQLQPASNYQNYPIVPTEGIGRKMGQYEIKERRLKHVGDQFHALIKRKVLDSFVGFPSEIPKFNLCFSRLASGPINAKFECNDNECRVDPESKNIQECPLVSDAGRWRLMSVAYASATDASWITPSLDTLKENYQNEQSTYVEFEVTATDLMLPPEVDAFSYQVSVNTQPVFINGWTQQETIREFDAKQRFKLDFGLQNLDFSGADFGNELITVELTFYADRTAIRTDKISRNYIALRDVDTISADVNEVLYQWSGQQHFGKNDGYEIFIWSSSDAAEIVKRRKKFFDGANIKYQGVNVVAVVRPPLSDNPNYGLVVGLVDAAGRIDFTFSKTRAAEIAQWLQVEVAPLKTEIRPETNLRHPLIKEVHIFPLKGH